jgi:elongation factor 1-gamma
MSFGKLYTFSDNPRSAAIKVVAKANKLDLEIVDATSVKDTPEYLKINPLNKVPSFEGSDGYVLTECMAIAIYVTSQNEKTTLLGKTKQDYASIVRWMSFANAEVLPGIAGWFAPLIGRNQYNKKSVDDSLARAQKTFDVLDKHLLINTYLVGERITLADLFTAGLLQRAAQYYFDKKNRAQYPNLIRWYETIVNQEMWTDVIPKVEYSTEQLKNVAPKSNEPKKEKAPAPKKEAASKPKETEEEEEDKPAPKPKHPLEALDKPSLVLDDWKRQYSNEETRTVALPWFWEHFKPEEYSLWQVDYKYNDELTQVFMSANLIGGFFARLEASRKYIFGCASVYGENNDSIIKGAFVIRGQDATPAFDVAPDFDSYEFTKLDHSKKEDREFVEDQWACDKPIVVGDKTYQWADCKVFK